MSVTFNHCIHLPSVNLPQGIPWDYLLIITFLSYRLRDLCPSSAVASLMISPFLRWLPTMPMEVEAMASTPLLKLRKISNQRSKRFHFTDLANEALSHVHLWTAVILPSKKWQVLKESLFWYFSLDQEKKSQFLTLASGIFETLKLVHQWGKTAFNGFLSWKSPNLEKVLNNSNTCVIGILAYICSNQLI